MPLLVLVWASPVRSQIELPGTQPGDLTQDIRSPEVCRDCHGGYAAYAAWDTWAGSMMANAPRDPLFLAALTVANQDAPGGGDLCIRCHSPRGWLFGRSDPPDGTALLPEDFEGVSCDFCHRLVPDPELGTVRVGNGQYVVADDRVRRGPFDTTFAPHATERSDLFVASELCAHCHDVSNPLEGGFAIERTYTEWYFSAFSEEGVTCQGCHFPPQAGVAAGAPGSPTREVHRHELAGGNAWMPRVLAGAFPELERGVEYARSEASARAMLAGAARVEVSAPALVDAGGTLAFSVRVENLTGHKLPTGYPEGRRCWLEVRVSDERGREVFVSGAYDEVEADRVEDAQLRTYEVRMAADGQEGFHFLLQDELIADTRIPPRGFLPTDETRPVGRVYGELEGGRLAHWDEAPYELRAPDAATSLTVEARLLYQTASREYVAFLRDENRTDDRGQRLYELWEANDRSPPETMATSRVVVAVMETEAGCGVVLGRQGLRGAGLGWLIGGLTLGVRQRRRRRCAESG